MSGARQAHACRLDNGLRVRILPTTHAGVAAVTLTVASGSAADPVDAGGVAHVVEHLTFRRAPTRGGGVGVVEGVGGLCGASTHHDHTEFVVGVPAESLDTALAEAAGRLRTLEATPADLDAERPVVLAEIAALAPPASVFPWNTVPALLFGDGPGTRLPHGDADAVGALDTDTPLAFHRRHYRPTNAVLSVAGGVRAEEVLDRVVRAFGSLSEGDPVDGVTPQRARPPAAEAVEAERTGAPEGKAVTAVGFPIPPSLTGAADPVAVPVLAALLSRSLRARRGPEYSSALVSPGYNGRWAAKREADALVVRLTHTTRTPSDRAVGIITEELAALGNAPPDERTVRAAVAILLTRHLRDLDDPMGLSAEAGRYEALFGDHTVPLRVAGLLRSVTSEQVAAAAGRLSAGPSSVARLVPGKAGS